MKILAFDLWGDYGLFRVPYTTTSPLTLPFPPKTALYGIIGAILGYDKKNYLEKFQGKSWRFSLSIKKPIVKTCIAENLINTKAVKMFARMEKGKSCRTQIRFEFLKNPGYRVYSTSTDSTALSDLEKKLSEHKSIYTVSLGLSECLANFKYIGAFEALEKNCDEEFVDINSIIPLSKIPTSQSINFSQHERKIIKIHIPLEMKIDRELIESGEFLVEAACNTISVKINGYYEIPGLSENIVLF